MEKSATLLALMFAAGLSWADAALSEVGEVTLNAPRDFGYVIGDVIRLEAWVKLEGPFRLVTGALPKPGAVNRWLHLRHIEHEQVAEGQTQTLRLAFEYQSFYAPLAPRRLTIPAVPLHFEGGSGIGEAIVPPWSFTAGPLHEVRADQGVLTESLRPDGDPSIPVPWMDRAGLAAGLLASAASIAYLAYLQGFMPFLARGRYFARAARELEHLKRRVGSGDSPNEAYRLVHEAFNRTIDGTLFAEDLDRFFESHPRYLPLRGQIEEFFQESYERFFAKHPAGEAGQPLDHLKALCQECLRIEQGSV